MLDKHFLDGHSYKKFDYVRNLTTTNVMKDVKF